MHANAMVKALGIAGMLTLAGCFQGPSSVMVVAPPELKVAPPEVILSTGHSAVFSAIVDGDPAANAAWSVVETGGGSMDASGSYHAPGVPGTYTVRAAVQVGSNALAAIAKVTVVALPAGAIQAPPRVQAGAEDQVARVEPVAGSRYAWTIAGGRITAGSDSAQVTFQAGDGPKVSLTCKVANAAGDVLNSTLEIPVATPVALTISPAAVTITAGRAMKFGYNLSGGNTLNVVWSLGEPGAGSLDDKGNYVAPEAPGLYTVRVKSLDDPTQWAAAQVKVVAKPPETLAAPESFQPGETGLKAQVPDLPGMTYAWEIEGGTITGGASGAAVAFQAGNGSSLTLRCRITNEAGDTYSVVKVLPGKS
jgi:hypothetical protein